MQVGAVLLVLKQPCLVSAAVFTVVTEIPHKEEIRPSYIGNDRIITRISDIHWDNLPGIDINQTLDSTVNIDFISKKYEHFWPDHISGYTSRHLHPKQNLPDYGSDIGLIVTKSIVRMLFSDVDPLDDTSVCSVARFLQVGLDFYSMQRDGLRWAANGGHLNGRKGMLVMTSLLLNDDIMQQDIKDVSGPGKEYYHEDGLLKPRKSDGAPIWGQIGTTSQYWTYLETGNGLKTVYDPYGMIDGANTYQYCCNSMHWKGYAIAMYTMKNFYNVWNNELFYQYVLRWVNHGELKVPDTCAPIPGTCQGTSTPCSSANKAACDEGVKCEYDTSQRGVSYGPDPNNSTKCIEGSGRLTGSDGNSKNDGYYDSEFINDVFDAVVDLDGSLPIASVTDIDEESEEYDSSGSNFDPNYASITATLSIVVAVITSFF
eukprot:TRINITY_DN2689_c0_g2_i2.p1 TRINITY_DN2689_c0_g2~~TRINITY_DN2689_c0_g2_i2.p1  ORF type:complete len:429 (+),score=88.37 TRINITY_DN2689_c0_g2_i2:18-1304(+)